MVDSSHSRFSVMNVLVSTLLKLSVGSLNKIQCRALVFMNGHDSCRNYTTLAKILSFEFRVCLSTSWNIIRKLKKFELITFDEKKNGVVLTVLGELLLQEIDNG
jgi:hypothetical protein